MVEKETSGDRKLRLELERKPTKKTMNKMHKFVVFNTLNIRKELSEERLDRIKLQKAIIKSKRNSKEGKKYLRAYNQMEKDAVRNDRNLQHDIKIVKKDLRNDKPVDNVLRKLNFKESFSGPLGLYNPFAQSQAKRRLKIRRITGD